jgi:hypothetical protein
MRFSTSLVALALVGAASTAGAQACLGTPSFTAGPVRLDGTFSSSNGQTSLGGGVSAGVERGVFGSVAINRLSADDDAGTDAVIGFGLQGGYELNIASSASKKVSSWSVCPVASFTQAKQSFSEFDEDVDFTARTFAAGVSAGTAIAASPKVSIAPFATLSVMRLSVSTDGLGDEFDDLLSASETGLALDLGAGFIISRLFTVRPAISVPIGFDGADAQFGVSVHFNFGK